MLRTQERLPWFVKVAVKLLLSRLPVPYRWWRRIGVFRHGAMAEPAYARSVFRHHLHQAGRSPVGLVGLELGPGDSLFSALLASASGFEHLYLVDVDYFAERNLDRYVSMVQLLEAEGAAFTPNIAAGTLEDMLRAASASYLTAGRLSLAQLPTGSVDFAWSHAVLEHVPLCEFLSTLRELRRVLRSGGVSSHRIDLSDHLGGGLNNLRFPSRLWESRFMSDAGFYTNRIRYTRMIELFKEAGFIPEVTKVDRWDRMPIRRDRLHPTFREFSDEELSVHGFDVVLRPG